MRAEMQEQPRRLAEVAARGDEVAREVRAVLPPRLAGTILVGRGSSDHAAQVGRYLIEMSTRRPVSLGAPSVLLRYGARLDLGGYLVVAVSQSGRTPEIADYLVRARAAGARTLAITNDPASAVARAAERELDLRVGEERAVPATKTVTAQLLMLALVARACGAVGFDDDDLARLPGSVAAVLEDPPPARSAAEVLAGCAHLLCAARGVLMGAALEVGLKLEEVAGRPVTSFASGDLLHGPIAMTGPTTGALVFSSAGPTRADVDELCGRLAARGVRIVRAGPEPEDELGWGQDVPEPLTPIAAVVRGQQVALEMALRLGRDPDRPEGLSKVTIT